MEQWKRIKGYENKYEISSLGRVKSIRRKTGNGAGYIIDEKILKNQLDVYGYEQVNISAGNRRRKSLKVHRLVATHFISEILPEGFQICHKDGCKTNNQVSNLYIGNAFTNALDKYKQGRTSLTIEQIKSILNDDRPQAKIASDYGVAQSYISGIKKGKKCPVAIKCIELQKYSNEQMDLGLDPILITGDTIQGQSVLIAEQIK